MLIITGHLAENPNTSSSASASVQVNYTNGSYIGQQTTEDLKYHGTELVMLYDYKVRGLMSNNILFLKKLNVHLTR